MDVSTFFALMEDKDFCDRKKMGYKYPSDVLEELYSTYQNSICSSLPLTGPKGERVICSRYILRELNEKALRRLYASERNDAGDETEYEISSTLEIEHVDFKRESVRLILAGREPSDKSEQIIYGIKSGLEFIADAGNEISAESLDRLYRTAVNPYLDTDSILPEGQNYRNDAVFVVGTEVEHQGADHRALPGLMDQLISYINADSKENVLVKAAVIHFWFSFLHPYFDGNGRMARLLHTWFLIRNGFVSAVHIPFSFYVKESVQKYYKAFSLIEATREIADVIDVSPFVSYFVDEVYSKLTPASEFEMQQKLDKVIEKAGATQKDIELWKFVRENYREEEFSTKRLEKDFGRAAYATIRSFVIRFEKAGLLIKRNYSNRPKYRVKTMY